MLPRFKLTLILKSILPFLIILLFGCNAVINTQKEINPKDPISFSQAFLLAQKSDDPTIEYLDTLSSLDPNSLSEDLNTDAKKYSFWINCYNTFVQYKLQKDTSEFSKRDVFFNKRDMFIGGEKISLNDIENGILRLKTIKGKEDFLIKLRPKKADYRIHFALNCGAESCPPIAFYDPKDLDKQLAIAEKSFLSTNAIYISKTNEVILNELFDWFKDDFGGESGIIDLLKKNQIIPPWSKPKISYSPYDWKLSRKKFQK